MITASGTGTVSVQGTGAASSGSSNYGVFVENANAQITSSGGAVNVTGQGGGRGASASNYGVYVTGGASPNFARISSGSNGNVSVVGTGGNASGTGLGNYGVYVLSALITANGTGTVSVQGSGGAGTGNDNHGVFVRSANAQITSSGGAISVVGTKGGSSNATVADVLLAEGGIIASTSATAGITVNATSTGFFPNTAGVDVSTNASQALALGTNTVLNFTINGTTVNTQYQQLNIAGQINLNSATLAFLGSTHTPVPGQTFTIVENDGADPVIGTFMGLSEGGTILGFLGSSLDAQITYAGGDGNDVVLTVVTKSPVIWDGTSWSPSATTSSDNAIIDGNYDVATNGPIVANNLTVNATFALTMSGGSIELKGDFVNNGSAFIQTGGVFAFSGTSAQGISGSNTFRDLVINNAAGVTLNNATSVTGKLTLTAGTLTTNGNLVLKSDVNGTAYIVGSLANISGQVTVERFVKDQTALGGTSGLGYRYFSSPITSATVASFQGFTPDLSKAADFNTDYTTVTATNFPNFFFYDESRIGAGQSFVKGWNVPTTTGASIPNGAGFIANTNTGVTPFMKGTLTSGAVSPSVSRGGQTDSGWNLLGNPYASPLNLDAFLADNTDLGTSAYIRIATDQYTGTWASYVNGLGAPLNAIDNGFIAPMQGFFVRKTAAGSGTASFTESQRADGTFNTFRKKADKQGLIRLKVGANGKNDECVVYFQDGATEQFDAKFDAYKVQYNPTGYPTIWQGTAEGEMLQISGMNEVVENLALPVSLWAEFGGNHTFTSTELKGLDGFEILLEDRATGTMTDLRKNASYEVELAKGKQEGRFFLHIVSRVTGVEDPASVGISLYGYAGNIRVALPKGMNSGEIAVFDMAGRLVLSQNIENQVFIATNLAKGIYIVRVSTDAGVFAKKVYLVP